MGARGLKNNNPGNIRINNIRYEGEIVPSTDKEFKQFHSMGHGYRAIFMLLYTYQKKYGLSTIEQFICRYAPPIENDTNNYIKNVVQWSGIKRNMPLNTLTKTDMIPVVSAISRMENGVEAISVDVLAGWNLFLVKN